MNIEELKRLAEAATPGPWEYDYDDQDHDTCIGILWGTNHYAIATIPYNGQVSDEKVTATGNYIAAANPAAVLELIAEVDRQRGYADDLTIALESSEKQLKDSRANDYTAMGYLADCRMAVGDNGKRMLPEFVEYLRQLRQQRDELLAALKEVRDLGHNYTQVSHRVWMIADAAIANAEKQS